MLGIMYWWCVAKRMHSTDARQDRFIVRAVVAAQTASREEISAHVALAVSPRTIGNRLLAAGIRSRVPLARIPLTPCTAKQSYAGVVKESTGVALCGLQ